MATNRPSRSSLEILRRSGLSDEPIGPRPRLDLGGLLVHTIPLGPPKPSFGVLLDLEGDPPPNRGITRPWPEPD